MKKRWIWPFELLEKIGDGGMGEVYRARFVKNDRQVAVKLVPEDAADSTMLARFEREMEILRSLRHPNIVRCFGGTCEGEQRFYAMELVEGGTLSGLLREQGRLSPDQTIEYALQMCSALAYAHSKGVVHRDIKPSNFLIGRDGRLKLSDFGLATIVAGRKITAADRTVGTFYYMAPEQIRGKPPVSPQTDLYGLGCVLFEMLTGRPPFVGQTSGEVLHQHLTKPPPRVSEFVTGCPQLLDRLVADLLEKDPENRPASAQEVARRFEEIRRLQSSVTVIERRSPLEAPTAEQKTDRKRRSTEAGPHEGGLLWPTSAWWVLSACAVGLIVLGVWNRTLAQRAAGLRRAESMLIEAYRSGETAVRVEAGRQLGRIGPYSQRAVTALIAGLQDENIRVRRTTVEALGEAGAAARPAVSQLRRIERTDTEPQVRIAAREALEKIEAAEPASNVWLWTAVGVVLAGAALTAYQLIRHRMAA